MTSVLQPLLGIVICGLFIFLARRFGAQRELRVYAFGLVVAAIIYLGFALNAGGPDWLFVQLLGVAIFTLSAWLGVRVSALFLGMGWALHAAWDWLMHTSAVAGFVPNWYPRVCLAFDLVLAVYIVLILNKEKSSST